MISYPLLWKTFKENIRVFLIVFLLMTIYVLFLFGMYTPDAAEHMNSLLAFVPETLQKALGLKLASSDLTEFLACYLFGFLLLLIPFIYEMITAHSMVIKLIERGDFIYLIGTPNSRETVIITQELYLAGSTFVLIFAEILLGGGLIKQMYPGAIPMNLYRNLGIGVLALHFFIGSFCFFVSAIVPSSFRYMIFGVGFPVVEYILYCLSKTELFVYELRYSTVFSLFEKDVYLDFGMIALINLLILLLCGILLYRISILVFKRRDLII